MGGLSRALVVLSILIAMLSSISHSTIDKHGFSDSTMEHRTLKPSDIHGPYSRFLEVSGSTALCPETIFHKTNGLDSPDGFIRLSYKDISHNGITCTGGGDVELRYHAKITSEILRDVFQIRGEGEGIDKLIRNVFLDLDGAYVGVEKLTRTCGGTSFWGGAGVLMSDDSDPFARRFKVTQHGRPKMMLIKDSEKICAFNGTWRAPPPSPTFAPTLTPSVSSSPRSSLLPSVSSSASLQPPGVAQNPLSQQNVSNVLTSSPSQSSRATSTPSQSGSIPLASGTVTPSPVQMQTANPSRAVSPPLDALGSRSPSVSVSFHVSPSASDPSVGRGFSATPSISVSASFQQPTASMTPSVSREIPPSPSNSASFSPQQAVASKAPVLLSSPTSSASPPTKQPSASILQSMSTVPEAITFSSSSPSQSQTNVGIVSPRPSVSAGSSQSTPSPSSDHTNRSVVLSPGPKASEMVVITATVQPSQSPRQSPSPQRSTPISEVTPSQTATPTIFPQKTTSVLTPGPTVTPHTDGPVPSGSNAIGPSPHPSATSSYKPDGFDIVPSAEENPQTSGEGLAESTVPNEKVSLTPTPIDLAPTPEMSSVSSPSASPTKSIVLSESSISPRPLKMGTSPSPSRGSAPTGTAIPDSSSTCFPPWASVSLISGHSIRMDRLQIGQRVRAGDGRSSVVIDFSHSNPFIHAQFKTFKCEGGRRLTVTPTHYIYTNNGLIPARRVFAGDFLQLENGTLTKIISTDAAVFRGIYNPHTMHGDIVVNGFKVSTYTTAIDPGRAHALLAPIRVLRALKIQLPIVSQLISMELVLNAAHSLNLISAA